MRDIYLSFAEHVTYLCATANRILHALSRVSKYIDVVYLLSHSFPNSFTGILFERHIAGGSTIKLIIFMKELCVSFRKTS